MISASEVHDLLKKIHDILDNAVLKQVGNMACILAHLFNSALRWHCEGWASQSHSIKDSVPLSEACLYGYTDWYLAQVHHQSSLGLSQSSASMMDARAKLGAGPSLMFRNNLCQSLVASPCQRNLTLILSLRMIRVAGS